MTNPPTPQQADIDLASWFTRRMGEAYKGSVELLLARHAQQARLEGYQQGVADEREHAAKLAEHYADHYLGGAANIGAEIRDGGQP